MSAVVSSTDIIPIEEEMKSSYLDYAMSVIVSRALPDVRDGLKPVHRRILFAMKEGGYTSSKPYRKSAVIVGDVMGKYHPHGDQPIYEALVRMAQEFAMRASLIDGQGNFGSMDGDPPAAMRYTESRLSKLSHFMIEDLDKDTVGKTPNYDNTVEEPVVLPARFPNLLVNGAWGIAVGMATNIPTHNLKEVISACCAYVDNPEITLEEIMTHIPGPDFPTGGTILGGRNIIEAYRNGKGSIILRGKATIEASRKDKESIIITEIPYQVNKAKLIENIADLVNDKVIEGISEIRDESDMEGVRVVVELKRDAVGEVILNQLYKHTQLQTSFGVNMLALIGGKPQIMTLKEIISAFINFRREVITRRTRFELNKVQARAHLLIGLILAVADIDEVIHIIKNSRDPQEAKVRLMEKKWPRNQIDAFLEITKSSLPSYIEFYSLSELQAKAILDLPLHRLTNMERSKIIDEINELGENIKEYARILGSSIVLDELLKKELNDVSEQFGSARLTEIVEYDGNVDDEELIQKEDMVVTVSLGGYIKRVPLSSYRTQHRGGRGKSAMVTKEEDVVSEIFVANTHTPMLFFTSLGRVYQLKVYKLPLCTPQSKGKALVNLLPLSEGETISTIMPLPDVGIDSDMSVVFVTSLGNVRRNALSDFLNIRANGKIAISLEGKEKLIGVATCYDGQDVFLATKHGKCIRFPIDTLRIFKSRNSTGVRGMKLAKNDEVISLTILNHVKATSEERESYIKQVNQMRRADGKDENAAEENIISNPLDPQRFDELFNQDQFILTVTNKGFGKRSSAYEYRITGRGGSGISNIDLSAKNAEVTGSFPVTPTDSIVLITNKGQLLRCGVTEIRISSRNTKGVTLFRLDNDEQIVSVARVGEEKEDNEEMEGSE